MVPLLASEKLLLLKSPDFGLRFRVLQCLVSRGFATSTLRCMHIYVPDVMAFVTVFPQSTQLGDISLC